MYNKLRLHAAVLSQWVFDVILFLVQPSEVQSVSFEREQWRNEKSWTFTQKKNSLWINFEAYDFASEVLKKHV